MKNRTKMLALSKILDCNLSDVELIDKGYVTSDGEYVGAIFEVDGEQYMVIPRNDRFELEHILEQKIEEAINTGDNDFLDKVVNTRKQKWQFRFKEDCYEFCRDYIDRLFVSDRDKFIDEILSVYLAEPVDFEPRGFYGNLDNDPSKVMRLVNRYAEKKVKELESQFKGDFMLWYMYEFNLRLIDLINEELWYPNINVIIRDLIDSGRYLDIISPVYFSDEEYGCDVFML